MLIPEDSRLNTTLKSPNHGMLFQQVNVGKITNGILAIAGQCSNSSDESLSGSKNCPDDPFVKLKRCLDNLSEPRNWSGDLSEWNRWFDDCDEMLQNCFNGLCMATKTSDPEAPAGECSISFAYKLGSSSSSSSESLQDIFEEKGSLELTSHFGGPRPELQITIRDDTELYDVVSSHGLKPTRTDKQVRKTGVLSRSLILRWRTRDLAAATGATAMDSFNFKVTELIETDFLFATQSRYECIALIRGGNQIFNVKCFQASGQIVKFTKGDIMIVAVEKRSGVRIDEETMGGMATEFIKRKEDALKDKVYSNLAIFVAKIGDAVNRLKDVVTVGGEVNHSIFTSKPADSTSLVRRPSWLFDGDIMTIKNDNSIPLHVRKNQKLKGGVHLLPGSYNVLQRFDTVRPGVILAAVVFDGSKRYGVDYIYNLHKKLSWCTTSADLQRVLRCVGLADGGVGIIAALFQTIPCFPSDASWAYGVVR
ncbi:hypothetical protein PSACC_00100 [Paramicrosporidium saccamoebae]|uniref:Uncharacterized protein n=1 Tax=Paramicrosporidium saccamoebae TaxID=1246581 RepID=A0A2H9TQQ9_9FUNG|nr:hypothetical protein PSACC_00100 [Paramicrosporidium saccamoebae]